MNETLDVCDVKRELKGWDTQMMKQGSVPTLHNQVRKKMRSTKHNWIEEQCDAIEKGMKAGTAKRPTRLRHTQ